MAMSKALLGPKIRRLRQERKLTQQQMAERLGISPSYLNLIEHDERPVTVALLLKLGQTLRCRSPGTVRRSRAPARGILARGVRRCRARRRRRSMPRRSAASSPTRPRPGAPSSISIAPGARRARTRNRCSSTCRAGGRGASCCRPRRRATSSRRMPIISRRSKRPPRRSAWRAGARRIVGRILADRLSLRHGITVAAAPVERMEGALRRYDPKARSLVLSQMLPLPSRHFHLAYQLGLIEGREAIDTAIRDAKLTAAESETLVRVGLANYFAGAVLMPYAPFLAAAQGARYDIEALMHRFRVSFEQAAHRLTTLAAAGRGAAFRSSSHASTLPATSPSGSRRRGSTSRAMAAPVRASSCTRRSRRRASSAPRSPSCRTAPPSSASPARSKSRAGASTRR